MANAASRARVYEVLNDERAYQDKQWGPVPSRGEHTPAEWLVYIADYTREAMTQCSRGADPAAAEAALRTIRKITAMGVACMEQCGAYSRFTDPPKPGAAPPPNVRRPLWREALARLQGK